MATLEDMYLDVYDVLLMKSERAVAVRGQRFDFDSTTWAISIISTAITLVANGILASWGEDLASSVKHHLGMIAKPNPARKNHDDNIEAVENVRRIVVELRRIAPHKDLAETIEPHISELFRNAGLEDDDVASLTLKISALLTDVTGKTIEE